MDRQYLEVTYLHGRPFAAYLYLPRQHDLGQQFREPVAGVAGTHSWDRIAELLDGLRPDRVRLGRILSRQQAKQRSHPDLDLARIGSGRPCGMSREEALSRVGVNGPALLDRQKRAGDQQTIDTRGLLGAGCQLLGDGPNALRRQVAQIEQEHRRLELTHWGVRLRVNPLKEETFGPLAAIQIEADDSMERDGIPNPVDDAVHGFRPQAEECVGVLGRG